MKTTLFSTSLLSLLAASVWAEDDNDVTCQTELGTKSVAKVKTDTITKTSSARPTTTITVTPTETKEVGRWSTITKFSTKTYTVTGKGDTDTLSVTSTFFKVATITVTATATTTSTKTGTETSTSTTQVPTTAGFKPIQDTVNSVGFSNPSRLFARKPRVPALVKPGLKAFTFPSKVHCTEFVPNTNTQTVRKTGNPITVSVMQTTTKVQEIPITTTIVPDDVSVTKVSTLTMSVTTYSTTWKTTTKSATATKTKVLPGPTEFAACSAENILGPNFNSGGTGYFVTNVLNNGPGIPSDFQTVANGASSAEECCTSCMQFASCETWIFRAQNRNCFLLYHAGATCKTQANHPNYFMSRKGADNGSGFVVGNGNCGYTYSGNSDGSLFSVDI
ncbi:hypothetical protein FHETE_7145 [Fusarium heterosporum]|uniref:Apple domain-containing protein n=1 Tax=Fusarium heterosporum TaxID=42747 RepID=A0A8H5WN68_FUSHE|nr:hypothetical protein FHETE_7145 [Fusarium heterosporum]